MIVQEDVLVRRVDLDKREDQADEPEKKKRRNLFILQIFCGLLCIFCQLGDIIHYYRFVKEGLTVTRAALPGLWSGFVFIIVALINLCSIPKTKCQNFLSVVSQVFSLLILIAALFLVLAALTTPDWRRDWASNVSYFYGVMLAFLFLEMIFLILSLRSSAQKWLRSMGYLDEIPREELLRPGTQTII